MTALEASPEIIKLCYAAAYDHDAVRILIGDALHPGGVQLRVFAVYVPGQASGGG